MRRKPVYRRALLALAVWLSAGALAAEVAPRIVAVGDIHGAYDAFRAILVEARLVDQQDRWIGGRSILVQTGDILDRGVDSWRAAAWLIDLEQQAAAAGGRVIVLLGNHEALNLLGELRDVHPDLYRQFAGADSDERRAALCRGYATSERRRAKALEERPLPARDLRQACLAAMPAGRLEYLDLLSPEGDLGSWLRTLPAAVEVDGVVFLHGGLTLEASLQGIEAVNRRAREELERFDFARAWLRERELILPSASLGDMMRVVREWPQLGASEEALPPAVAAISQARDWSLLRQDGPLWFRGYAKWSDDEGTEQIAAILSALSAEHLVVGHTPQTRRSITSRFDDRVFLIDTGMLASVYQGQPAALEIREGRFTGIYLESSTVIAPATPATPTTPDLAAAPQTVPSAPLR